jgi:hypothetical protein
MHLHIRENNLPLMMSLLTFSAALWATQQKTIATDRRRSNGECFRSQFVAWKNVAHSARTEIVKPFNNTIVVDTSIIRPPESFRLIECHQGLAGHILGHVDDVRGIVLFDHLDRRVVQRRHQADFSSSPGR